MPRAQESDGDPQEEADGKQSQSLRATASSSGHPSSYTRVTQAARGAPPEAGPVPSRPHKPPLMNSDTRPRGRHPLSPAQSSPNQQTGCLQTRYKQHRPFSAWLGRWGLRAALVPVAGAPGPAAGSPRSWPICHQHQTQHGRPRVAVPIVWASRLGARSRRQDRVWAQNPVRLGPRNRKEPIVHQEPMGERCSCISGPTLAAPGLTTRGAGQSPPRAPAPPAAASLGVSPFQN